MAVSLIDLLHRASRSRPDAAALSEPGKPALSYRDLETASRRIAETLHTHRGDRVGLLVPKSVEAVVGLWGAMATGAAYVPIDPAAPSQRAAYIASDCNVAAVLVSGELDSAVAAVHDALPHARLIQIHGRPLRIDGTIHMDVRAAGKQTGAPAPSPVNVRDLAYILYTSGSTGMPKGVMVSHGAALSFVDWAVSTFDFQPSDVFSNHAPFHFDLSVLDLFGAAAVGGRVVVLDEETVRFPMRSADVLESERITVWYSVPGALRRMLLRGKLADRDLSALRTLLFAGEVYPIEELRALQAALPRSIRFANLYGPTETNVCTFWEVPPAGTWTHQHPPIGVDCASCEGIIVDERLEPVTEGSSGELLIRGGTLMTGYWGDSERTERSFIKDFRYPHLNDRLYRTGDIVSRDTDGLYRFHGRRDHMVKVRGYRVELGEVEAALHAVAGVREAVVIAVERQHRMNGPDLELVAFVVTADGNAIDDAAAMSHVKNSLAGTLPKYMLPSDVCFLPRMPTTSSGKVDRQALTAMAAEGSASPS